MGADARRAMRLYNPATGRRHMDFQSGLEAMRDRLADKGKQLAPSRNEAERLRPLLPQYDIVPDANVP